MKIRLWMIVVVAISALGCRDSSQDIPPGASVNDPLGVNAQKQAEGSAKAATPQQLAESEKRGQAAKNFGEEMNRKYGNR